MDCLDQITFRRLSPIRPLQPFARFQPRSRGSVPARSAQVQGRTTSKQQPSLSGRWLAQAYRLKTISVLGIYSLLGSAQVLLIVCIQLQKNPAGSLRLDAGRADYLGPLLRIFGDELDELSGRLPKRLQAQIDEPRLKRRISDCRINLLIE